MKHTPGPWMIEPEAYVGEEYYEPCVITKGDDSGQSKVVAIIRVGLEGTQANARLIAASPDLLLELRRLSREVGGMLYGFEHELREAIGNTNFAILKQKVKEAETAIAKATEAQ